MTCEFIPSLANADICKTCGTSFASHRESNKPSNAGRKRYLTAAQELHVVEWWQTCRTVTQKARELGVSKVVIYKTLARYDPSRRPARQGKS